ncbi:MAG: CHASE2 domain-containing protein [Bacteroidota bacterium]|nr:CHASE2 domain-containing protein [Bacteroidota bacterium]
MPEVKDKSYRKSLNKLLICMVLSAIIILLASDTIFEFAPFKRIELATIDNRFNSRGAVSFDPKVVIVEISEASIKSLPDPWPWPRHYYARLIRNLKKAGAEAIGIDLIMGAADFNNPAYDDDLRKALSEVKNVALAGKVTIADERFDIVSANENYSNIFFGVDSSVGIVYLRNDEDGVHRRFHPIVFDRSRNRRLPTFSFAVLNKSFGVNPLTTVNVESNNFVYENITIPSCDSYTALINYYGPSGTFVPIKFVDVIDDKEFQTNEERELGVDINTFDDPETGYLYDGTFKNKVVLIGSTNPEDKDLFPVPIAQGIQEGDNLMYGVEIHANIIQSILDQNFLKREPIWLQIALVFFFVSMTFFFTLNLKSRKVKYYFLIEALAIAVVISELFLIVAFSILAFNQQNFVTSFTGPLMAVTFGYVGSMVYSYVSERKQKVLIKSMFSQYVSPTVVNELVDDPTKLRLGGERKILTVLFTDLENFTSVAESVPPEELVPILNAYFEGMTEIILKNNGTLDKYIGDSIMAFFGAPIPQKDHSLIACRTAVQMQSHLEELRQIWKTTNKPLLHMRIGINTGDMIVGNMGGLDRFDYTVIGDSVNLSARLEGANKQYKTKTLISENTFQPIAGQVVVRELDLITVVGKNKPLKIYELFGLVGDKTPPEYFSLIEKFSEALFLYRQRNWEKAIKNFEEALKIKPDDYPSKLYIERSQAFIQTPPPDNWDGVFVMKTK